ncbi:methyl-accepting chemotaxis protein [Schwartzia succinivorans]|jgi:methyl-accepting chemotaxis protein|uniref:Methyl-accepting chemotaxis protein n=1 Tax=Schwartzia succinivorans DSM 10502 TaxID=1123243 RepID=A0A1M4Z2V2_9FIRM|nr:methyl-accepting chemotaxis protein [Schwartzia succinivorans]SHF12278.1 methyl-accepting chemotaxis protein [Schwartzia succinivorans DSM 10502]
MMKWLDDIRVAYKLAILAVVTVVGMMIIGGSGYFAIKKAQADMETMYASSVQTLVYIGAANGDMRRAQAMAASAIVSANDPARVKKLTNSLQESLKAVEASIKKLDEIPGKNADAVALLEKIKKDYNELKPILERTLEYVAAGQSQSAGEYYTKNGASRASAIGKELAQLTQLQADIAKQLNEQNDADTERTIRFMVVELIVVLAISVVAVLIITKKITTPLELMTNALVKLRDGDFIITQRTIQRDDEFGALANMVADVRKSLNRLMRDTNASAEQLAAASEELTASSQQAAQASSMVANSVTDAAGATAEQQTYVNDAMESINNTAESVERLNQTAETVSQHASESKDEAEAGSKAIQQAVEQIMSVETIVQSSAATVDKLGKSSQEIGQIVSDISEIAEQTNLLALNAAIEAARAGENGRGFSVVAEEVRKLAEQSQEAAQRITNLIGGIQSDTNEAVQSMQEGSSAVKAGTESVSKLKEAFDRIQAAALGVSEQADTITAEVRAVADQTANVKEKSANILEKGTQVSGEMENVSAASEEQSASASEIADASNSLAKLAQDLQNSLSKFRF